MRALKNVDSHLESLRTNSRHGKPIYQDYGRIRIFRDAEKGLKLAREAYGKLNPNQAVSKNPKDGIDSASAQVEQWWRRLFPTEEDGGH